MTWFKVDDSLHSHPKAMAAGLAPMGLWLIAGSWSNANLTDGFVPDYMLPRFADGTSEHAEKLVAVGLWRRAKGGYRFHDWHEYQPTRESRIQEREKWRDKKAKQRAGYNEKQSSPSSKAVVSPGDNEGDSLGDSPGDSSGESRLSRSQSRSRENNQQPPVVGGAKRATRIPDNWTPSNDLVAWAQETCPNVDGRYETQQFVDYWRAKSGKDATKLDWDLTFQTWFRRANKDAAGKPQRANNRLVGANTRGGDTDWNDPKNMEF
jgi:hypothetical protein